jgi:hypothetical protein
MELTPGSEIKMMQDILTGYADHSINGSIGSWTSTRPGREWSISYHVSPEYAEMSLAELDETLWGHPDELVRNAVRLEMSARMIQQELARQVIRKTLKNV